MDIRDFATGLLKSIDSSFSIVWGDEAESVWAKKIARVDGRSDGKRFFGRDPWSNYTWDGSGVLRMSEGRDLLAIHDVAHALLAPKRRLRLPEFGLGPDPSNHSDAKCHVSPKNAQREEDHTCWLHWTLAGYLYGRDGAKEIVDYLSLENVPPLDAVEEFRDRFTLPSDYFEKVLQAYPP